MMNQVIHDEGANRGRARHREDDLTAVLEGPRRQHLRIAGIGERGARRGDVLVELRSADRRWMAALSAGSSPAVATSNTVFCRIGVDPVRDVGNVPGELAEAERLVMRLPRELRLGRALEQPPRRPHLVIEFRQQCIFQRHG